MENQNKIHLIQTVLFSKEDPRELQQSASYDPAEDWLNIIHNGHEIPLSRENFEKLMELGRRTYSGFTENSYTRLKNLKLKDSAPILEAMTDEQILELMREDAEHVKIKYSVVTGFTKILFQEIFRRNGLGYKSLSHLSFAQKSFIQNLNIYEKVFK